MKEIDGNNEPVLRQRSGQEVSPDPSISRTSSTTIVQEKTNLKRDLGLLSGTALIVGTMIGSGIFISPKGVIDKTGSVGLSLLVWAGCGILSTLGALCYAELGTMITKSGAEYAYLYQAYGPVPAYLFAWTSVVVLKTSSVAIICLAFAEYTLDPIFDDCGPPNAIIKLLAASAIIAVTLVNCISVKLAARVQVLFTVIKLAALLVIIIGGMVKLAQDDGTRYLENGFEDSTSNPSKIALAFYSGLWAYDGWNNLNFVTEEIRNPRSYIAAASAPIHAFLESLLPVLLTIFFPSHWLLSHKISDQTARLCSLILIYTVHKSFLFRQRNLPLAIMIAIPLVTVVYLLTNISYLTVMSKEELIASSAVASLWGDRVLHGASILMPIAVACSTFGAANGSAFTGGRLTFVASREGHLPDVMSYVSVQQFTPLISLIVNMIISLLLIIPGDIETLIDFFSFAAWIFYGSTASVVIFLRFKEPHITRPFKVPLPVAIIFVLICIYLVIGPIVDEPKIEFLYATIFIFSGLIFYVPFVHFRKKLPGMDSFTMWVQLLAEVSPSQYEQDPQ